MADLAAGTTVLVHESRQQADGSIRARITLSGSTQGWCTSVPKDGIPSLHEVGTPEATAASEVAHRQRRPSMGPAGKSTTPRALVRPPTAPDGSSSSSTPAAEAGGSSDPSPAARRASIASGSAGGGAGGTGGSGHNGAPAGTTPRAMATYVISAPKPLLARGEFDLQSSRVGELNPGTKVHVLETRPLPDAGGKRVRLALAGQGVPYGWVTSVTKSGQENLQPHLFEVVAAKPLLVRSEFDTKVCLPTPPPLVAPVGVCARACA